MRTSSRLLILVSSMLLLLAPHGLWGQTLYAVVLGNPKYVVGSSTLHSGLYMSRDTGRSWTHLGPENLKGYTMDALDSSRGRILFIAAGNGVHKSTDHGATWRITTGWQMTEVMDVHVDQSDPRFVYAATAFGFWRSTDGGEHWESPRSIVDSIYSYRIDLHAGILLLSGERAIYASTDRGVTWKQSTPMPGPRGVYRLPALRLVPTSEGPHLLSTASDSLRLDRSFAPTIAMNTYAIAGNGRSVYAVGDKGVWEMAASKEKDLSWRDITGNLPNRMVHAATLVGSELLVGTFGEGIFRRSDGKWIPSGLEGSQVWSLEVKGW